VRAPKFASIVLLAVLAWGSNSAAQTPASLFELYLESLRQQAGIPGLTVVIVDEGQVAWERGLGLRDVENVLPVFPDTPFPVSDLTQTFAWTLLAQCIEQGTLELDAPIRTWTPLIPEPSATVRQVLAHTSSAPPGSLFKYDPARFAALTPVVEACSGEPYRKHLTLDVLERLGMADSVAGHDLSDPLSPARDLFEPEQLERFAGVFARLAVPYKVDKGKATRAEFPPKGLDTATGIISTGRDLARYDAALDDGILLRPETLAVGWNNNVATGGAVVPTGLGWFVQLYGGQRIVWHFGMSTDAFSSLVVKIPAKRRTMILLANSDGLAATSPPLAEGDVTASPFARLFLRFFL
jgi:CubicO group peptidase (beta-lactamase class C family)